MGEPALQEEDDGGRGIHGGQGGVGEAVRIGKHGSVPFD